MSLPRGRGNHLEDAIRLVTADRPDVVCLQELPIWGFRRLEAWSGMRAFCTSAKVVRLSAEHGRRVTLLHQAFLRSAVSGQGNAILVRDGLDVLEHRAVQVSRGMRERRVCHAVRLDGMTIGNVHCSNDFRRPAVPARELGRAFGLVEGMAEPGDMLVLAGDLNLRGGQFPPLPGWSAPGPRIDHVLVRGAAASALRVWPEERRVVDGRLLSDHAPVETTIG